MQKWGLAAVLFILLASLVSAQQITGYVGMNVVTPAQSVEATTSVSVDNKTVTHVVELPGTVVSSVSNLTKIEPGTAEQRKHNDDGAFAFFKRILAWIFG